MSGDNWIDISKMDGLIIVGAALIWGTLIFVVAGKIAM